MNNPMDKMPFIDSQNKDVMTVLQNAMKNPNAFEEQIRRSNPQAYQQALQIRNSQNPQMIIMQMMKERGMNTNILNMLGLM